MWRVQMHIYTVLNDPPPSSSFVKGESFQFIHEEDGRMTFSCLRLRIVVATLIAKMWPEMPRKKIKLGIYSDVVHSYFATVVDFIIPSSCKDIALQTKVIQSELVIDWCKRNIFMVFFKCVIAELCNKNQVDTRLIERRMTRKWFLIAPYLQGKTKHFTGYSNAYACVHV